jgi:hypothetical protein
MKKPKPSDPGTGVEGPAGASPDITAGTLTTHTDFVIEMPLTPPSLINKTLNIKVKPITLAFGTLGYTGGTPGGNVKLRLLGLTPPAKRSNSSAGMRDSSSVTTTNVLLAVGRKKARHDSPPRSWPTR